MQFEVPLTQLFRRDFTEVMCKLFTYIEYYLALNFGINVSYQRIICTSACDISVFILHFTFGLSINVVVFYEISDDDVATLI